MAFPNENQRIVMVTGKGGVGKSAVAAALATVYAAAGKRTLLVEMGDHSYFSHVFRREISYEAVSIGKNLSVACWSGQGCLREYVLHLVKIRKIVDLFFENRVMRTFIRAAPALKELAILGKVTSGIRQWGPPLDYDVIVVDGYATGHFLALLKAPIGMAELIEGGPMGEQSRNIQEVLRNPTLCRYVLVTLPEELPVTEAIELQKDLRALIGAAAEVILNRTYDPKVSEAGIQRSMVQGASQGERHFAEFLKGFVERQQGLRQQLSDGVGHYLELPMIFSTHGQEVIAELAKRIEVGWKSSSLRIKS